MIYQVVGSSGETYAFEPRVRGHNVVRSLAVEENISDVFSRHYPHWVGAAGKLDDPDRYLYVLERMVAGCRSCELCVSTERSRASPIYRRNPRAVFIGRSPSRADGRRGGLVLPGTSTGAIFDKYLSTLGMTRTEVSVLNMVQCYMSGGGAPTSRHWGKCSAFKRFEFIYLNDFEILFLMCNDSIKWFFGDSTPGVGIIQGNVYEVVLDESFLDWGVRRKVLVVPLIHPNGLVLNPEMGLSTANVLRVVRQILDQRGRI